MPQEQTAAAPTQVTPQEFAAKIKTKYPVYANVPDDQLVEKITAKYPQYKTQIKQAAPAQNNDPLRGAAQATGLRPSTPFNLEQYLNSPEAQKIKGDMENTAMGSAGLGGMVRGAQALFKPTTSMVPEISKLLGPTGKPLIKMVEQEGPSAAQKAAQTVMKSIKSVPTWMKANPVKAAGVELAAHELGVDPIQLAHKLLKYGGGLVP